MNEACSCRSECDCPPRCFCKYDVGELLPVAREKQAKGVPAVALMKHARSDHEKELICVVAMLDLDDSVAEIMIREHMSSESCDVSACRNNLQRKLNAALQ